MHCKAHALRSLVLAAAAAFACASAEPNAPAPAAHGSASPVVATDAHVRQALVASCWGCHAEGAAPPPWSARLAPSYWFPSEALAKLDFSAWDRYDAKRRAEVSDAIVAQVRDGEMPPWDYTLLHSAAALAPEDQQRLVEWARAEAARARP